MSVVYIGIGSNLGDRQKNIDIAMEKLNSRKGVEIATVSSLVETEPIGDANQPKFLNGVCKVETGLYPDELLDALKSIERELGRNRDSAGGKLSQEEQLKMFESGNLDAVRQATEISNKEKNDQEQKRWGSREIDLDILFYDDIIMKGHNLTIPHPLLHERLFVLKPLAEIAPDIVHPVLKKSIKDLLSEQSLENNISSEDSQDTQ